MILDQIVQLAPIIGLATYYAPGLMEMVAGNRQMDLNGYVGGVALNDPRYLGHEVWLLWADESEIEGPFLVVDCAARQDIADRERLGLVVEVDARIAQRRGFYGVGPRWVIVLFEPSRVKIMQ